MTQEQKILNHLQSGRTINPREAINLFNCYRLAARIFDLHKQGYNITSHLVQPHNYAIYTLIQKPQ